MFKNRALQIQLVKKETNNVPNQNAACNHADLETINKIAKANVTRAVLLIGGAIACNKILNAACTVIVSELTS